MIGGSLLTLIDDIALIMDDVALMSKMAAKKTVGVVSDDLALNANQIVGVRAERELPIIYEVAKGSIKNKLIIIPIALLLSMIAPWLIVPLLMLGGAFLCFEGAEKIIEERIKILNFFKKIFGVKQSNIGFNNEKRHQKNHELNIKNLSESELILAEKEKIKGAIKTDFILSSEIMVISLGAVSEATILTQAIALSIIGLVMTFGVYGLVALLVKIDDMGLWLKQNSSSQLGLNFGSWLLLLAPKLMKILSVVGTAAMFTVGGSIIIHGLHINVPFDMFGTFVSGLFFGLILTIVHHYLSFISIKIKKH